MTDANPSHNKKNASLAVLGASRGLGAQIVRLYEKDGLPWQLARSSQMDLSIDFSQESQWPQVIEFLREHHIERVFYCAGGGPYGFFASNSAPKWAAQEWAHRVSFLFPAYLIHHGFVSVKQMVFIGSSVAESAADPGAAMYSASKHALRGLIATVQAELKASKSARDLRLFSPGYMDTDLLPKKAWPRVSPPEGMQIHQPGEVAQRFRAFADDPSQRLQNLILEPFQRLSRPS